MEKYVNINVCVVTVASDIWGFFWTPLPTLKSDVIHWHSLVNNNMEAFEKFQCSRNDIRIFSAFLQFAAIRFYISFCMHYAIIELDLDGPSRSSSKIILCLNIRKRKKKDKVKKKLRAFKALLNFKKVDSHKWRQ